MGRFGEADLRYCGIRIKRMGGALSPWGHFPYGSAFARRRTKAALRLPSTQPKCRRSFTIHVGKRPAWLFFQSYSEIQMVRLLFIPFSSMILSAFGESKASVGAPFFSKEMLVPIPFVTAVKTVSSGILIFESADI